MQQIGILVISCRPCALTRRFRRISKCALTERSKGFVSKDSPRNSKKALAKHRVMEENAFFKGGFRGDISIAHVVAHPTSDLVQHGLCCGSIPSHHCPASKARATKTLIRCGVAGFSDLHINLAIFAFGVVRVRVVRS